MAPIRRRLARLRRDQERIGDGLSLSPVGPLHDGAGPQARNGPTAMGYN